MVIACGHSITNKTAKSDIGSLMLKYGGGGHQLACGATLNDWETVDNMIKDLCEV
jgi:nanoRNase/pAp phosphatase (c-di-AMP/oligoRNAs hydrolase)